MLCRPFCIDSVSMSDSEYGWYGVPRPLAALFWRSRPPGIAMPVEAPCPAIPVLAMLPLVLMVSCERSMPFTVGADPAMLVLAAL